MRANTARVLKPARPTTTGPQPIPPGHWIIASRRAGQLVPAEHLPDPDCAQCVARNTTASSTSQEVQP